MFYFVRLFFKLRYLKNCLSPRRKGAEILFLESICDFASLREPHFWDYSKASNCQSDDENSTLSFGTKLVISLIYE